MLDLVQLRKVLEDGGYYVTYRDTELYGQCLTCGNRMNSEGRMEGNSFWIATIHERWFIASWGGRIWEFASEATIFQVCCDWLESEMRTIIPPSHCLESALLVERNFKDFHEVFAEKYVPAFIRKILHALKNHKDATGKVLNDLQDISRLLPVMSLKQFQELCAMEIVSTVSSHLSIRAWLRTKPMLSWDICEEEVS